MVYNNLETNNYLIWFEWSDINIRMQILIEIKRQTHIYNHGMHNNLAFNDINNAFENDHFLHAADIDLNENMHQTME